MMSETTLWIVILVVGLGTLLLRLSFIQFGSLISLPPQAANILRFVPAAVLSAIVAPAVLRMPDGGLDYSLDNPRLLAAIVAGLLAWKTKGIIAGLVGGMAALWILQAVM